jgi:hypothetical protein
MSTTLRCHAAKAEERFSKGVPLGTLSPYIGSGFQASASWAAPVEQSVPFRRESQLPAATFTLESFLRFHFGRCASAVWTLHRANVSHNVNFSWLLTSFRIRDIGFLPNWRSVAITCSWDFHMHFWFHDAEGELAE